MFAVGLMVIWTLSTFVKGTDYLVSVHSLSYVDVTSDGAGGSVKISSPNRNVHQGYGFLSGRSRIRLDEKIGTKLGFDNSTVLISCSHSAMKVTVYSDNYKYNVFIPLPVTALGTNYVVSSCIQNEFEYSVLVMTAYKRNADIGIKFNTNVDFSYDGQMYTKGDTLMFSLRAYQTFTFRVRHDLSGTRINSTETIAVFSGTGNSTTVYTYTQLLPVEQFSDEYVVTVDDSLPSIQLQIVGEHNSFQIRFNDGIYASTESSILNRILMKNETFYFESSKPVMATICRSVGDQKGFALVPPVSYYRDQERLTLRYTSLIVTLNTVYMDVSSSIIGGSEYISLSKFKVGRFWRKSTWSITATGQSTFSSIVFTFRQQTFYIDGLSLAEDDQPIKDPANTFIMVAPKSNIARTVMVAVGDQEAYYQVRCSGNEHVKTRNTYPYVADFFIVPLHSVCFVETDNEHLQIFLQDTSRNRVLSLALFPVKSLRTEYVIPSHVTLNGKMRIILATGNWKASVNITIKEGIAPYDLLEYQTAIVDNEVSGMVVSVSREVPLFIENIYEHEYKYMYSQLIPTEDLGNEYAFAVGSIKIKKFNYIHNLTEEYYINITCLDTHTNLIFNDGVAVTIDKTKFYHRDVFVNESLHFASSKPVISYLCLKIEFHRNDDVYQENPCTILPPVERYDDSAVINIPSEADLKIMTKQDNDDVHAYIVNYRLQNITFTFSWENIPKTDYKVGTATNKRGIIFLKSTQRFSTIVYGYKDQSSPRFYTSFSIYTSSPSVHQETPRLSTKAALGQTDISTHHQQTTDTYLPTAEKTTQDLSQVDRAYEEELNSDGNVVMVGDNNVSTVVVGCVCGIIILVLGCIIGFLVFRMKRNAESKLKDDPRNPHSAPQQPTTLELDHVTRDRGQGIGAEAKKLSDMTFEWKVVNPFENCVSTGQNEDFQLNESNIVHENTYSDLSYNGQTDNKYESIVHLRQDNDYVNV